MSSQSLSIAEFERAVSEYHSLIFRTAMGFVHSKEDAEDITQEVFLKAYQSWAKFRGDAEVSTWLYRIAVNLSLNYIAQKKRKGGLHTDDCKLAILSDSSKNPQQELEAAERARTIRQAIDSLPDKQRMAFVLSRYNDLSQKQVAEVMQTSEGAIEQLLQRAKINLQKKLEQSIGKVK